MEPEPLHTKIDKIIQLTNGLIVLENPNGFPRGESNIYFLTSQGQIGWKAEKPDPNTLFSRVRLNQDGQTFSAYTQGGHACDLDLRTGKLISFTTLK